MVSFILPGNSASTGYEVDNSLRFNDGSTDHLDRTFGSAGNRRTFTISFWAKLTGNNTPSQSAMFGAIFDAAQDGSNSDDLYFHTHRLNFSGYYGSTQYQLRTTAKYRDPSAWYHFVVAFDTTQSTASNRIKIYVNGVQETEFDDETYPSQDFQTTYINTARLHNIGTLVDGDGFPLDGYLAEFVFIDGQQLLPTSFGEFDEDTGIWKPIDVSGLTFGTNGFYLEFKQSGTSQNSSGLGADTSGNDNHFAVSNLTSIDQSTDTCTNNFATMNPLVVNTSAESSFAEGNLQVSTTDSGVFGAVSTIGVSSGKWYWEVKPTQIENKNAIGVTAAASADAINNHRPGDGSYSAGIRSSGDAKLNGSSESGSWDSFTTSDIVGVALDLDNNKLYFSKNGTFMNSGNPTSGSTGTGAISLTDPASTTDGFYFFAFGDPGAGSGTANIAQFNFGSPPYSISSGNSDGNGYGNFEYSVPSGYYALNTKNLAEYG